MSNYVHDPLLASAVAFSDETRSVIFVACDVILIPRLIGDAARRRIAEHTGVEAGSVMVTATHTHSGPVTAQYASNLADTTVPRPDPTYLQQLQDAIVRAGCDAFDAMVPAHVDYAVADGSSVGGNRHDPAGPSIPQVPVLRARSAEDDRVLAIMAVCTMHPTVLHEDSLCISGDFPSLARRHLQQTLGHRCPFVYHMGAAGNQSPRHVTQSNTLEETDRLGRSLAEAIDTALHCAKPLGNARVASQSRLIHELPLRELPGTDEAEQAVAAARRSLENLRAWHAPSPKVRSAEVDWFGAEETLTLSKLRAQGELDRFVKTCLPAEVQVFTLGNLRFVGWPGEVFVEFAQELRETYPDAWVITLANGDLQGYVVSREAVLRGAYEAGNAVFQSPESGDILVEETRKLLANSAAPQTAGAL